MRHALKKWRSPQNWFIGATFSFTRPDLKEKSQCAAVGKTFGKLWKTRACKPGKIWFGHCKGWIDRIYMPEIAGISFWGDDGCKISIIDGRLLRQY